MKTNTALAALTALSAATRLSVFRLLVKAGPDGLAAGRIAELAEVPASSLSFHLKELSIGGLVHARQDGRFLIYSANYDAINDLIGFLTENCCEGEPCAVKPIKPIVSPTESTP